MALNTRLSIRLNGDQSSALDLGTVLFPLDHALLRELTDGSGSNQANKQFSDQRAIATGGTDSLDLAGGSLVDAFGVGLTWTALKLLLIVSLPTNTTNLTLFGDANSVPLLNTAATTITLPPGGVFAYLDPSAAGRVVTAGTGDIIKIVNAAGATANYNIVIIGS